MATTHRAVAAFLDLAETSLSPRGTVSHTQLTKEQIQEQAAAALQDALKISDEAEKAEKIREVGKAEGKLLSALLTQSGVTAIAPSHPVVSSWYAARNSGAHFSAHTIRRNYPDHPSVGTRRCRRRSSATTTTTRGTRRCRRRSPSS